MLIYSVVMLLTGALLAVLSIMIYKGKTELIHSYHQTKVTDKRAYGKAFGKALSLFAIGMITSGIISLCRDSDVLMRVSIAALGLCMLGGIIGIAIVQKKYNNGIF